MPTPVAPLVPDFSARTGISPRQAGFTAALVLGGGLAAWLAPRILEDGLYALLWLAFMANALLRLSACCLPIRPPAPEDTRASNENLPLYSVIVALYKEADIVPQLLANMLRLDYPRDRLEILFTLEADDHATLAAFGACRLPPHARVVAVPPPGPGEPRTKPRALNHALALAHGDLVVIYDAEDQPHPDQLRAAARAFHAGDSNLACVQAPLRPVGGSGFVARQFAAEYAVQFDVLLPALNALGLPFPLGGTSNHFKAEVLKAIGAWDAFNVTEDADLGLRLAQYGHVSGLIAPPTHETPPSSTRVWLPQRTRWIKGYLQTLGVHTRLNTPFRWRVWAGLVLGVGMSAMAALLYAPFSAMVVMTALLGGVQWLGNARDALPAMPWRDLVLFASGSFSAVVSLVVGARRAGIRYGFSDMAAAPVLLVPAIGGRRLRHLPAADAAVPLGQDRARAGAQSACGGRRFRLCGNA